MDFSRISSYVPFVKKAQIHNDIEAQINYKTFNYDTNYVSITITKPETFEMQDFSQSYTEKKSKYLNKYEKLV